ncbi:MAG TPA: sodium:proton antiporter [Agrobacterium sp.]|nr:sodium:proton antiporter [Agrobacterium sp.]
MAEVSKNQVEKALEAVIYPGSDKNIVALGMVSEIFIADAKAYFSITVPADKAADMEPLRLSAEKAAKSVEGIVGAVVALTADRKPGKEPPPRPAAAPGRPAAQPRSSKVGVPGVGAIIAVASGKGGVGKSSVTANLAAALAKQGLRVGLVDADIYGFSIPTMFGLSGQPTRVDEMIIPQVAHGVKVMSIGMFVPGNQAVVWRGPMLHRALQQFLTDVFWGDLDVLLLDLPPGTGDIAISVAQLLPNSELLVVTTPQQASAQVAERAGAIATQTKQPIAGVVENMSWMEMPDGTRMEVFGSGGGATVAGNLATTTGTEVELLTQIPLDTAVREGSDAGTPVVLTDPESPAAQAFTTLATRLAQRTRGLSGRSLGLSPV